MDIFEGAQRIGTLAVQEDGLFYKFSCQIEKNTEQLRRIYVIHSWRVEYLGIPDRSGALTAHIARSHLPDALDGAVASPYPPAHWRPWRGVLDGIAVDEAYVSDTQPVCLALSPLEAVKFPTWVEQTKTEKVFDREMALLTLSADGHLPENGGTEDETPDCDSTDPVLPDDAAAGDADLGGEREETDCPDL